MLKEKKLKNLVALVAVDSSGVGEVLYNTSTRRIVNEGRPVPRLRILNLRPSSPGFIVRSG